MNPPLFHKVSAFVHHLRPLLVAVLLLSGIQARAAHILGGSITYDCQSGNNYIVTLDLFYDCSGVAALAQTLHFTSACNTFDIVVQPPPPQEVSQICPAQLVNSSCNGGGLQGVNWYSFQTPVTLPPCPGGWNISWVTCCRATTVDLVGAAGTYLEAELRNDLVPCDDSPIFTENSAPYVCVGDPVSYNFGVTEPNGDSISYTLIGARGFANSSAPIAYKPGYSAPQPVAGTTLDPVTGQLEFTPPVIGKYVFVIEVQQYDANGVLIGSVMRDIMVIAMPCNGSAPVAQGPAVLTGPGGPGDPPGTGALVTGNNALQVCNGSPFCFSMEFSDADAGDVLALTSQISTLLPGATSTVSGSNPLTITICWTGNVANSPVNLLIQVNDGACPIVNTTTTAVNITSVNPPGGTPDPGTNAVVQVCPTATIFNLIDQLGGTPDAGGTWTGPGNVPHGPQFDPATDVAGVYTYMVGNACLNFSSTLTVSFTPNAPDAGADGNLNVCGNAAPVPLISGLGGTPDATGTWTEQVTGTPVGANYDPLTQAPGVYVYTVAGSGGCASAQATVTVTEVAPPNAGTNGALAVCANGTAASLFNALGGTPVAGGAWSGPSAVVGGMYNPATMNPGNYVYTVTGVAPCGNATATVSVTEQPPANAGTNGSLNVCTNAASVSLFTALGGTPQAGGTWSGPSAVVGGMYDPATMLPGAYVYTVNGVAPCGNATATVTVTEQIAANAGVDAGLNVCESGAATSL
ncbi:MAG: hypothetical protein JST38_08075, partial [Bacteroidetes bacterium]|nr:hypothetical protein [Bacteroidota bacterium]